MAAKKICPKVNKTEKPCKKRKRFLSIKSVARFIAGINNCRAATALNITKDIHAALYMSDRKDSNTAKPEDKITKNIYKK